MYLIINLYVSIFTGSTRRSMPTHAPTGEISGNHSSTCSVHVSVETPNTIGVGGEVPHEIGTLNAYIYISFNY